MVIRTFGAHRYNAGVFPTAGTVPHFTRVASSTIARATPAAAWADVARPATARGTIARAGEAPAWAEVTPY